MLKDNGYDPKKYEIMSRVTVLRKKALIADIYDIFYEVKAGK